MYVRTTACNSFLRGGPVRRILRILVHQVFPGGVSEFCPMGPGSERLRLPPGRKPVRCARKPFARGMRTTNRVILRCPPSVSASDHAVCGSGAHCRF